MTTARETREELQALAWEAGKGAGWEEMDEDDDLPSGPFPTSVWAARKKATVMQKFNDCLKATPRYLEI